MSDYDFVGKMKENRAQWAALGFFKCSSWTPTSHKLLFQGLMMIATGEELLAKIDNNDEETINIMADRKMNFSVAYDPVIEDMSREEGDLAELAAVVRQLRIDQRNEETEGKLALQNGDSVANMYHFARQYALNYCSGGCRKVLEYYMAGGVPPAFMRVNLIR